METIEETLEGLKTPGKKPVDQGICKNLYPFALESARRIGLAMGYAIGLHGSEKRDLDLIAVPWTDEAKPAEELVHQIAIAIMGYYRPIACEKPHGRRAWSIYLGHGGAYVDLSVMPIQKKEL